MKAFDAIERLARVGFLVKGLLYIVIGALALQVATRAGGRVTGTRGALVTVLRQPFGHTLVLVVALGLVGYAAWRILTETVHGTNADAGSFLAKDRCLASLVLRACCSGETLLLPGVWEQIVHSLFTVLK